MYSVEYVRVLFRRWETDRWSEIAGVDNDGRATDKNRLNLIYLDPVIQFRAAAATILLSGSSTRLREIHSVIVHSVNLSIPDWRRCWRQQIWLKVILPKWACHSQTEPTKAPWILPTTSSGPCDWLCVCLNNNFSNKISYDLDIWHAAWLNSTYPDNVKGQFKVTGRSSRS